MTATNTSAANPQPDTMPQPMNTIIVKHERPTPPEPLLDPSGFINDTHDNEPHKRNIAELLIKVGQKVIQHDYHEDWLSLAQVAAYARRYKIRWRNSSAREREMDMCLDDYLLRSYDIRACEVVVKYMKEWNESKRRSEFFIRFRQMLPDGSATCYRPTGLIVSGGNTLVATNTFSYMATGITLAGDDPDFPQGAAGIATNSTLVNNRFCTVTNPVVVEPLATNITHQGTLLCPFPPPALAIAPAVLLAWPGEEVGWTVETAISVIGPWAASDATPFMQYGRHSLAVPSDGEHRFFRLRSP